MVFLKALKDIWQHFKFVNLCFRFLMSRTGFKKVVKHESEKTAYCALFLRSEKAKVKSAFIVGLAVSEDVKYTLLEFKINGHALSL